MRSLLSLAFCFCALSSCGRSIEDHVDRLANGGSEDLIRARHELLAAGPNAVAPLLEALDDPQRGATRPEVAALLVDLLNRLGDDRIGPPLRRHLIADPDRRVRERIAFELGLHKREEFADSFLEALRDSVGQVRAQAMAALGRMRSRLSSAQGDALIQAARLMQNDDSVVARLEARFVVADRVEEWLREGRKRRLKGLIAEAESLYRDALDFAPGNMKAGRELGMLYLENGSGERGLQVLRESGWLLDVPLARQAPQIDGRLDDEVWRQAGTIERFFTQTNVSMPALESPHPTWVTRMRPSTSDSDVKTPIPRACS